METKCLDLHEEKSCYLIIGKGKECEKINNDLKRMPLTIYGKPMKQKVKEKYLDDLIHSEGLAASAKATVDARAESMTAGAAEV